MRWRSLRPQLFLLALAKVEETGRGAWWLAAGAAAGIGLLSKYTMFFLGLGTVVWLLVDPRQRHWFRSIWPYAGAAVAAVLFAPNLWWNQTHGWATFAFQFGRLGRRPFHAALSGGIPCGADRSGDAVHFHIGGDGRLHAYPKARSLATALVWPSIAYFVVHALHDRVQGNWPSFLYPILAIAAVGAANRADWRGWHRLAASASRRAAIPVAGAMLALLYVQALTGIIPLGRKDPMQRLLAFGLPDMTKDIVQAITAHRANAILTTDYEMTAWLRFYLPADLSVVQVNEPWRWASRPHPSRNCSVIDCFILLIPGATAPTW